MTQRLDVRKKLAEKKYTGELRFSFEGEESLIPIPYVSFSAPVTADLSYEILEDETVRIRAKVSFSLKGLCSRCLKETEQKIVYEHEGYFIPEGGKGEEEDYSYSNGFLDLSEFMRDAVLFSMPNALLCGENCSAPEYRED